MILFLTQILNLIFNYHNIILRSKFIVMFKFLQAHQAERLNRRSPIKYQHQTLYGISIQSPPQFHMPFTIVNQNSYTNPYLKFQEAMQDKVSIDQRSNFNPKWIKKTNPGAVQEYKIGKSQPNLFPLKISDRYSKEDSKRFLLTKGQFSNFIQKHNHYRSIGPLHGKQRTYQRIQNTKKSIWIPRNQAISTLQNSTKLNSESSPHFSLKSKQQMSQNTLLTQKSRIRLNRQTFHTKFNKDLQDRKKYRDSHYNFQLPKKGSQFILESIPRVRQVQGIKKKINEIDKMVNLDNFEQTLSRKFK